MPDAWTNNPEKLRDTLIEMGANCGIEPRVLAGRDPEWTCGYDSKGWLRDVYIHWYGEFYLHPFYFAHMAIVLVIGIFLGLFWGKRFWKKKLSVEHS